MTDASDGERNPRATPKRFRRFHFEDLVLSPVDARRLGEEIRRAFPDVKFASMEYWRHYVDWRAWRREIARARRAEPDVRPLLNVVYRMSDPSTRPMRYFDTLADAAENQFYIWREPNGWAPVWGPVDRSGIRYIVNIPPLNVLFRRGDYRCEGRAAARPSGGFVSPPRSLPESTIVELSPGHLAGTYYLHDADQKAFQFRLANILRRMTTTGLYRVDRALRRPYRETAGREATLRSMTHRYGLDAERWALARRENYFAYSSARGLFKPVSYPYAPEDFIGDDELPPREIARRANLAESERRYRAVVAAEAARRQARAKKRAERARAAPRPR